jgi:hypothetical protein
MSRQPINMPPFTSHASADAIDAEDLMHIILPLAMTWQGDADFLRTNCRAGSTSSARATPF